MSLHGNASPSMDDLVPLQQVVFSLRKICLKCGWKLVTFQAYLSILDGHNSHVMIDVVRQAC